MQYEPKTNIQCKTSCSNAGAFPDCQATFFEGVLSLAKCLTQPSSPCPYRRLYSWTADSVYSCYHPRRMAIVEQTHKT